MSTPAAQVRVRLSAEGVRDVVSSLKAIERQAKDTASARGFGALNGALREFKGLLPAIGVGALAVGIGSLVRNALQGADALGKLSQKTGATVEDLSALNVVGRLTDVSLEQIQGGVTKLARSIGELEAGSKPAVRAFASLGLAAKDFKDLDTGQAFELVAKRVMAIEDPFRRAQIGTEVLGRGFADLIPVMQAVADQGLGPLREQAQSLGLLITGDLAAAADAAGDSFDIIKIQADGLATAFVSGLAPSIVAVMSQFSESIKGDGVKEMQEFGRETGRILRVVIRTFQLFGHAAGNVFTGLTKQVAGFFAFFKAVFSGDFARAGNIWKSLGDESSEDAQKARTQFLDDLDALIAEANRDAPAIRIPVKVDTKGLSERMAAAIEAADAAAEKASTDSAGKRARDAAERARKEQLDKETAAAQTRLDLEQRILEITGHAREARLSQLDEEIAKIRQVIAAANGGKVPAADEAKIQQFRAANVANLDFEDAIAKAQAGLEDLARQRERIEQDVQLGISTEAEGQTRILALEQQRLITLQQLAAAALAAAQATGSPEAIAQAQAIADAVAQVDISVRSTQTSLQKLGQAGQDAFTGGLADLLGNLRSFSDVGNIFNSLAATVASALQRMAAEMLAASIQAALFKAALSWFGGGTSAVSSGASAAARGIGPMRAGGVVGYAGGGPFDATGGGRIRGPGTGTSDSIPAITTRGRPLLVSNGEFIVREAVVRQPGMMDLLHTINAGRLALDMVPRRMPRGFVEGGAVSGDAAPAKAGRAGFAGVLGLEEGLVMRHLESEAFDKLLVRKLERNRTSVRSVIG